MRWLAQTLWDLLGLAGDVSAPAARPAPKTARGPTKTRPSPMQQRYAALVSEMKKTHGVRVRRWRSSSTGCAWEVHYADGTTRRLIEAPYPRGPVSCAIFLHEIGHHAIGFGHYRPRCLEEYHAWQWALETMRASGFNVTAAVTRRVAESLHYALEKARRRGLKQVPPELVGYM